MSWLTDFDISILNFIRDNLQCGFLDTAMPIASLLAEGGVVPIAFALVFILIKKKRKTGIMMGLALLIGVIIGNVVLKNIIGRTRPYDITGVMLIVRSLPDYSFPSGHSLAVFEIAGVLMVRDRKFGIPALVIAFIVAFSRIYLYLHHPSDVIGGALLGLLFAFISIVTVNAVLKKLAKTKPKAAAFLGEDVDIAA